MKKFTVYLAVAVSLLITGGAAFAADKGIVEKVEDGCRQEIETYCKGVTPGEGRVLACLYAYQDKLSNRCEYALYDAAAQLERVVAALTYVANECRDDLKVYCSGVKPGEGRLLDCIDRNKEKVSDRCNQAIRDIGPKKK